MDWKSKWVWNAARVEKPLQRCFFRYRFMLSQPGFLRLKVSADSRYKLYMDGEWIGEGPAAGDLMNYRYESYGHDEPVGLEPGEHVMAIEVLSYGRLGPVNEVHERGGLIVEGRVQGERDDVLVDLATPGHWLVHEDLSFGVDFDLGGLPFYCAFGFTERIDFLQSVGDWLAVDFEDREWGTPVPINEGGGMPVFSDPPTFTTTPWLLTPREIPPMERVPRAFSRIVVGDNAMDESAWNELLAGHSTLMIPAGVATSIVLDPGTYVTAYPDLEFEGGRDAVIRLTYAESFSNQWKKGLRDEPQGQDIEGYSDLLTASGERCRYRPFRWRAFRFLKIEIEPSSEPLTIHGLSMIASSYPLKLEARWDCDDSLLNDLWPISWRTLRVGAHEHLMDSPYYECLQYVGDTTIQALTIRGLAGDTCLWKRAMLDFNASRLPMGLTQSRYPSRHIQLIPSFSLVYVTMVEEYLLHTNDRETVRICLRGLEQVVDWFSDYQTEEGYLGVMPWWNFVDWTPEWLGGDPSGMTSAQPHQKEPSSTINFFFIRALQSLSKIHAWLGDEARSARFLDQSKDLQEAVRRIFWDERRGLFAETPAQTSYSEHANVLAILTRSAEDPLLANIADALDGAQGLISCGYQFEFYLAQSLSQVNRNDLMIQRLKQWQNIFDLHLVTTPERSLGKGLVERSDSHAWSAWTPYWMLSEVLGIQPLEPGFGKIRIKPQLGGLRFAEGRMPLPSGILELRVEIDAEKWSISGSLPPAEYILEDPSGQMHELCEGKVELKGYFAKNGE